MDDDDSLLLSLTLSTSHHAHFGNPNASGGDHRNSVSPSSCSGGGVKMLVVKRERENSCTDEEVERVSADFKVSEEEDDGGSTGGGRKKLRLRKEQSALLEESFKHHSTLNPKQKQDLARKLSLRPRQVEVWFQNRRARSKLKQTEADCELLRKCYESLTDENRKLQKEVHELKALKLASQTAPFHSVQILPAVATTTSSLAVCCPSCGRVGPGGVGSNPSAAC
ncbi:Homeobox-leucine zipper protein HAT14 [Linum perenne]